jgi:hypothetical protein
MKTILALIGIAMSFSANSLERKSVKSIDVHNLSKSQKQIWVNGTSHSIESESSLWVPCLPEEKMEIQISNKIETLVCGENMELNN